MSLLGLVMAPLEGLLPMGGRLPPPLTPADGKTTFTFDSVQRRLPLIVEATIDNNPAYSEELCASLRAFAGEIAAGAPLKPLKERSSWDAQLEPHLAAAGTWFSEPWWVTENYFYKRLLELTDPATGGLDPFAKQKADSLAGAAGAFARMLATDLPASTSLAPLVETSLWGNLADLSVSAGKQLVAPEVASKGGAGGEGAASMMLADESEGLVAALLGAAGAEVVIVLDNCGLELVSDLLLVDGLLRLAAPSRVTLHVKDRPVFVSDVTRADLPPTLEWLAASGGPELSARLSAALTDGRLAVEAPEFYTSSLPFWRMPAELREQLGAASIVLLKGDANYRRLLGDLHWPHDTDFAQLMEYWPTSVAALRTCKSGVLVGTDPAVEAAAAAAHPGTWLTGGLYGVVQLREAECDA